MKNSSKGKDTNSLPAASKLMPPPSSSKPMVKDLIGKSIGKPVKTLMKGAGKAGVAKKLGLK